MNERDWHILKVLHEHIAPALLLETGADPRLQQHRVEWLGQVVLRAELNTAHHAVEVVERRDHDHRDVAQPGIELEAPQDLEAVHVRHHDVEQDQVDRLAGEPLQSVSAIHSAQPPRGRAARAPAPAGRD